MKIDGGCHCGYITYEAEAEELAVDLVVVLAQRRRGTSPIARGPGRHAHRPGGA